MGAEPPEILRKTPGSPWFLAAPCTLSPAAAAYHPTQSTDQAARKTPLLPPSRTEVPGPSSKLRASTSSPWGGLTEPRGPKASAGSRRPPPRPRRSTLPRSSLLPARPPRGQRPRPRRTALPGPHTPSPPRSVGGPSCPQPQDITPRLQGPRDRPFRRSRTPQPTTTRPQPAPPRRAGPAGAGQGREATRENAHHVEGCAGLFPPGSGGDWGRRRQRLPPAAAAPAPHGPFRRLPLMRSAAHRPRRQPERRGRGATGGSLHRGGGGAAAPSRPAPLPAPSGFSLGAAGGRSAAVGTCGANGGWSSQAAEGGRGRLGLGREGRGRSPRSPRCYCGVESGGGRPAPRRGCGEEKVAGREGTAVVAARRGGVPPPSEGPPGVPPRLLHTPPPPLPSPYPGHPASTFLSGKLGFLFLKYQNT